jgi:hypothetical protein
MSPGHYSVSGQARKAQRNYRTFNLRSTTEIQPNQPSFVGEMAEDEKPSFCKPAHDSTLCWIGALALLIGLALILNLIVHAIRHCDTTVVV